VIGVLLTGLIVGITEYFTSKSFNPVKSIAKASTTAMAPTSSRAWPCP